MSSSVTPAMSPAAGSTSRGMAMSTISNGRPLRRAIAVVRSPCSSMMFVAPVEVSSTSTWASSAGRSARRTARPSKRAASAFAVSHVRLATTMSTSPAAPMATAMPSPISPAPSTSTRRPLSVPSRSVAIATAACATEVMPRPMPVSVRARLPTSSAWRNSRLSDDAGRAFGAGDVPRRADLAEDLALADHRGVEPGGHGEQVRHGRVVVVDVEVVGELLGRQERQVGEEVAHVLVAAVEPLGHRVDLGAVARRQDHRLGQVLPRAEVVQGLGQPGVVDRHPLEQVERRGAVVQSDDDDRHACRRSLASARCPSRIISSIPESRARFQPGSSVGFAPRDRDRPGLGEHRRSAARIRGRARPSKRSRSHAASAGLCPPVANVTSSGPRRTRAGRVNEQCAGSSAALTHTPAASASSNTAPSTAGSPVAVTDQPVARRLAPS